MPNKDNLPQFFEELKIKEDATFSFQDLITQLKQQIPLNYLEITLEEGNYSGSTNPKWKNKPLSERYFFTYQEKEIQLDLPHSLMDKLGLKKGEDITQPLYLDPQVLTRKETYKGITLQEGEIIIVNPHKLIIKDQEIQTDLGKENIEELEINNSEKNKEIEGLKKLVENQKEEIAKLKIKKSPQELLEASAKLGGSWKSFYDWLNINVANFRSITISWDIGQVRDDLKIYNDTKHLGGNYLIGDTFNYVRNKLFPILLNSIEQSNTNSPHKTIFIPYDDKKSFEELTETPVDSLYAIHKECWGSKKISNQWKNLFNQWRNESTTYQNYLRGINTV